MKIRSAVPDDAEAIARINVHTWQVAYAGLMPAQFLAEKRPSPPADNLRAWLARTDRPGDSLVAVDERGAVVGYTHFGPLRLPDAPAESPYHPSEGEIHAIYVTPEAWGTGAGRDMMTTALRALAEHGRTVVRLWVLADNDRACRFYERAGFVPDGTRRVERLTYGSDGAAEVAELRYVRHG
jgi:ribosomal protein S18 acetylase RimI-like enzyme